jgi:O-antigen ligase
MNAIKRINNLILYILIFAVTFEYWDVLGGKSGNNEEGGSTITRLISIVYVISSIPLIRTRLSLNLGKYILVPFYFYLGFEMLGTFTYADYLSSFTDLFALKVIQLTLLLILISSHLIEQPLLINRVLHLYIHSIFLLAVMYYLGYGRDIGYEEGVNRLFLFGENPNRTGFKVVVAILMIIYFLFEKKLNLIFKIYYIALLVIIIPILPLTGSRGPIFILFVSVLYYIIRMKKSIALKSIILICSSVVAFFLFQYFMQVEVLAERINKTINEGDTAGRDKLWLSSLNVFLDNPLTGVGRVAYKDEIGKYMGFSQSSHNVFIETLVRAGLFGFVCYMIFFLRVWRLAFITYKRTGTAVLLLMIFATTLEMSKSGGVINSIYLWFIISIIVGGYGLTKQNS